MDGPTKLPPPPPLARLLDSGPAALFLDFDGTLVELAGSPEDTVRQHLQRDGLRGGLVGSAGNS